MRSTRILVEGILLLAIGVLFGCKTTYVSNVGSTEPEVSIRSDVDANHIQDLEERYRGPFTKKDLEDPEGMAAKEERYLDAWTKFHQGLINYFVENGFRLKGSIDCAVMMYCAGDGSVEHYIIDLPEDLEEGSRERFISLTTDFLRKHGMLTTDYQAFSMRGPVVFTW